MTYQSNIVKNNVTDTRLMDHLLLFVGSYETPKLFNLAEKLLNMYIRHMN